MGKHAEEDGQIFARLRFVKGNYLQQLTLRRHLSQERMDLKLGK